MKTLAEKTRQYWTLMRIWNGSSDVKDGVTTGCALKDLSDIQSELGPHRSLSEKVSNLRWSIIVGENRKTVNSGK